MQPEGKAQWQAVEPFCSQTWEDEASKNDALKPGKKYMSLSDRQKLMRARVDAKFVGNYDRLTKDGWLDRAFVNYFAGSPGSRHANMTEELIRSVHLFSKAPIFVLHLGSVAPPAWNAERFPNLILVHAAPMGVDSHRSFNFNKIRSFLLSRVRTGVELDSDQFVAPGVDYMFDMTDNMVCEMNAPAGPCRQLQSWSPKEKRPSTHSGTAPFEEAAALPGNKNRHVYLLFPPKRITQMYGNQKPTCTTCLEMG